MWQILGVILGGAALQRYDNQLNQDPSLAAWEGGLESGVASRLAEEWRKHRQMSQFQQQSHKKTGKYPVISLRIYSNHRMDSHRMDSSQS
jgi:hypothetical protein